MKKFLAILLGLFTLPLSAYALTFPDVPEDHANFAAVESLAGSGVLDGYDDGNFRPGDLVNRAEAVKIIVNALDVAHSEDGGEEFPDVDKTDWFFSFVMDAVKAKILDGYEDGNFRPGDTVNLAETLKVAVLASEPELKDAELDVFADVYNDQWFADYALYARDKNVVVADAKGKIYPAQDMTRAAFAEVIYRMMTVADAGGEAFPLNTDWTVYHSASLPFKLKYDAEMWDVVEHRDETVFYQKDAYFDQFSPTRIYPNSARVIVSLDDNDNSVGRSSYFANLREAFEGATFTDFNLGGLSALEVLYPDARIVDWYIYLDSGRVLAIYTEYGDGLLSFQLPKFVGAMLQSLEIVQPRMANAEIMSTIFANVLVANKGMEMIKLLPDRVIIETDTIGVGTGPVDYYYSDALDYTLKYERHSDVILDTREGRTSAF